MADLESLLERTSRTFALTIPLLPEPTRRAVTTAYLLFRIADTFEDSTSWSVEQRTRALSELTGLLAGQEANGERELSERWTKDPPLEHEGYIELLAEAPLVIEAYRGLHARAREIVREHVGRTAEGMAGYVSRAHGSSPLELESLDDLRQYCYVVAGIVGEMLTELFLVDHPATTKVARDLRERARWFGEGLQLTNILKDAGDDHVEGRRYLPAGVPVADVFAIAREDLTKAYEYVTAVQRCGAPRDLVAFNALPLMLAWATLDRVESHGPGAKLTRPEVFDLVARMERALDDGRPAFSRDDARLSPA